MLDFFLLVCGIAGLWFGSETLVNGATSLADRYRITDALFGMLVLAIGTDLPELFVAFDASFRSLAGEDLSGIVIGSAVGNSIAQFALVFGIAGFSGYPPMKRMFLPRNCPSGARGLPSQQGWLFCSWQPNSPSFTRPSSRAKWGSAT